MPKNSTRCLIVDDEPLAVRVINAHLNKVADLEVVATCSNAIEAFEIVQKEVIDLIFLDIQMPELTGIELIKSLEHPPKVIFVTAYRDYALEGFELDVVDYLLKPVSLPRLLRAIDKYHRLYTTNRQAPDQESQPGRYLTVRSNRQNLNVQLDSIRYIESLSDYTKLHTAERTVICKERISHLAEKLEPSGFLRIHRSFLVSLASITAYTAEQVTVDGIDLPISRSYRNAVKQILKERVY